MPRTKPGKRLVRFSSGALAGQFRFVSSRSGCTQHAQGPKGVTEPVYSSANPNLMPGRFGLYGQFATAAEAAAARATQDMWTGNPLGQRHMRHPKGPSGTNHLDCHLKQALADKQAQSYRDGVHLQGDVSPTGLRYYNGWWVPEKYYQEHVAFDKAAEVGSRIFAGVALVAALPVGSAVLAGAELPTVSAASAAGGLSAGAQAAAALEAEETWAIEQGFASYSEWFYSSAGPLTEQYILAAERAAELAWLGIAP